MTRHEATESEPRVGGWLLLLCRFLLVYQPLSLAFSASIALNSLPTRGPKVLIVGSLVFHGAWLAYLVRSKRVARVYGGT